MKKPDHLSSLAFVMRMGCSVLLVSLSGCQMVSVKQQQLTTSFSNERDSILTRDRLSEASLNVLSITNRQVAGCITDPARCLADLQQIPELLDEQAYSTGSEIYLAHAIGLQQSAECNAPKVNALAGQVATPDTAVNQTDNNQLSQAAQLRLLNQRYQTCLSQQVDSLSRSIRYSYAYLYETQRQPQQRLFDNRQVQVKDFYNQAIANLVNTYNTINATATQDAAKVLTADGFNVAAIEGPATTTPTAKRINTPKTDAAASNQVINNSDFNSILNIGSTRYHIDLTHYPTLNPAELQQLTSTYNLSFSGLSSISRRDGFGAEFVLQLKSPQTRPLDHYLVDPFLNLASIFDHPNIHGARYLPATVVVEPLNGKQPDPSVNAADLKMRVIDPNLYQNVTINGYTLPLAANFSAPYGLWLANNNLDSLAYRNLLNRDNYLAMPHLYMLEPYNPKKRVIVMIHGLASSPQAWVAMTNDMMGDPVLRDHYQVWQVFYSTRMPILESRYQIYALLKQTFDGIARQSGQPVEHAVLIGHSMGGLIGRLLVSDSQFEDALVQSLAPSQRTYYRQLIGSAMARPRLHMNPLVPPIDRAVFIASPFKGTQYADRWFTLLARRIIQLPGNFITAITSSTYAPSGTPSTSQSAQDLQRLASRFFENGPTELSEKSRFTRLTANTRIVPQVTYHTIMGNEKGLTDLAQVSDGIVTYQSAHLEGAQSEKVIKGGHSIQMTPEAILELRRILRLHLQQLGEYHP